MADTPPVAGSVPEAADRAVATILRALTDHIEVARDRQGLTVAQLAARAGLSRRSVILLRKCQVQRPSLNTVLQLAHAAGLHVELRVRTKNDGQSLDGDPHGA